MSRSDLQDPSLPEAQSQASVGSYKLLGGNVKPKCHPRVLPWQRLGQEGSGTPGETGIALN